MECSNGVNVNCEHATYRNLTLIDSEGIEAGQAYSLVEYCNFTRSSLTLGGNQSHLQYGLSASHCTFDNDGAIFPAYIGVGLTDNTSSAVLSDMTIRNCDTGFALGGQSGLPVLNAAANGFEIFDCRIGIYSSLSTIEAVLTDGLVSGHLRGAEFASGNIELRNYTFTNNGVDIYIRNTVEQVFISSTCNYDTIYIEDGANVIRE